MVKAFLSQPREREKREEGLSALVAFMRVWDDAAAIIHAGGAPRFGLRTFLRDDLPTPAMSWTDVRHAQTAYRERRGQRT